MATNDMEMIEEVRSLTDYDDTIVADSELQSLLAIAKDEIETEAGTEPSFYSDQATTRALFWLTCFFTKVKSGEYDGLSLSVSEIEVSQIPSDGEGNLWFEQFQRRMKQIDAANRTYHGTIDRTNRTYGGS